MEQGVRKARRENDIEWMQGGCLGGMEGDGLGGGRDDEVRKPGTELGQYEAVLLCA